MLPPCSASGKLPGFVQQELRAWLLAPSFQELEASSSTLFAQSNGCIKDDYRNQAGHALSCSKARQTAASVQLSPKPFSKR